MESECTRLASNQKTLLETLPEITLLIDSTGSVEYMNPCAAIFLSSEATKNETSSQLRSVLLTLLSGELGPKPTLCMINDVHFEGYIGPFCGYSGDKLYWVILKRMTIKTAKASSGLQDCSEREKLVGSSPKIKELLELVTRVAPTDATVLISGESGTGKGLFAKIIQQESQRKDKPFLTINCSSISEGILESELFGHEKGAFTGAEKRTKGKFELVDGGTIFLDEIGDISPAMQTALLRVLQDGEIIRVGGSEPLKIDVRIISATNRNLEKEVKAGRFRLDLFFRLSVIKFELPPLRERQQDLLQLTEHFIDKYKKHIQPGWIVNGQELIKKVNGYHWPGNIRELESVVQRAIFMCKTDSELSKIIPINSFAANESDGFSLKDCNVTDSPLKDIVDKVEKEVIVRNLTETHGNVAVAAEKLKLCKAALYEKIKRHDISAKSFRAA